jgi:hypothetical protein
MIITDRDVIRRRYTWGEQDEDGPIRDCESDDELARDPAYCEWEGCARYVHDETGVDTPVDAFTLAYAFDLRLNPRNGGGASLNGQDLFYDASAPLRVQHMLVAHEVGHYALRYCGEPDSEEAADYLASALMLPRRTFDRDLIETAWDLEQLCARHPNVTGEVVALRIPELREAMVTVADVSWPLTRLLPRSRVWSPWFEETPNMLTAVEYDIAGRAVVTGETQRFGGITAYPLRQPSERSASSVVIVADGSVLKELWCQGWKDASTLPSAWMQREVARAAEDSGAGRKAA